MEENLFDSGKFEDAIREKIERAFAQFERGEFYAPAEAKALRERRKAEWLAENRRGYQKNPG